MSKFVNYPIIPIGECSKTAIRAPAVDRLKSRPCSGDRSEATDMWCIISSVRSCLVFSMRFTILNSDFCLLLKMSAFLVTICKLIAHAGGRDVGDLTCYWLHKSGLFEVFSVPYRHFPTTPCFSSSKLYYTCATFVDHCSLASNMACQSPSFVISQIFQILFH